MSPEETPAVSVVVVIVSDTVQRRAASRDLAGCLAALSTQVDAQNIEIIVPHHPDVDALPDLRKQFPAVRFIEVDQEQLSRTFPGREHHDVLRARGLMAARGELIGLLEDHARPDPHWCANVIAAHRQSYAAIGGAIENDIDRPLNWAVYYCDFGRYQRPLPRGESWYASDANVSYKRRALETVRPLWEQRYSEVIVNEALMARGEKLALDPDVVVYQNRPSLRLGSALRERFVWGRSYARTRITLLRPTRRLAYGLLSPLLPPALLLRMTRTAWTRRRLFGKFLKALPYTVMLLTMWSIGEGLGYLTGDGERTKRR